MLSVSRSPKFTPLHRRITVLCEPRSLPEIRYRVSWEVVLLLENLHQKVERKFFWLGQRLSIFRIFSDAATCSGKFVSRDNFKNAAQTLINNDLNSLFDLLFMAASNAPTCSPSSKKRKNGFFRRLDFLRI